MKIGLAVKRNLKMTVLPIGMLPELADRVGHSGKHAKTSSAHQAK